MRVTARTTLVSLAAGALLLSGCGGGEQTADKPDVLTLLRTEATKSLQASLQKTERAKSASFTMEGTTGEEKVNAGGAIDYSGQPKAEFTMDDPENGPTLVRLIGTAFYYQVPEKDRAEMDGKKWMKLDFAEAVKLGGGDASSTAMVDELTRQMRQMDPVVQVKTVLDAGELKVVGEETIGGARTVHYSGALPIAVYLKQVAEKARPIIAEVFRKAGITAVQVDLWVDENYQPRRARSVAGKMDITMTYSDYGKPVNVVVPPANETADLVKMLQELRSAGKGN